MTKRNLDFFFLPAVHRGNQLSCSQENSVMQDTRET